MQIIEYLSLDRADPTTLVGVLNEDALREHLVDHPYFDAESIRAWVADKLKVDATVGCKVRAVVIGGVLAGWCGIQPDGASFEIAIVLSKRFWGYGVPVFKHMMGWAQELEHEEVCFHFLETRR